MFNINNGNEIINFSGSQFDGLENIGSKHLVIKTGSDSNDIKKFALTTEPLDDRYKSLKMRISNVGGGGNSKIVYIAQKFSTSYSDTYQHTNTASENSSCTTNVYSTRYSTTNDYFASSKTWDRYLINMSLDIRTNLLSYSFNTSLLTCTYVRTNVQTVNTNSTSFASYQLTDSRFSHTSLNYLTKNKTGTVYYGDSKNAKPTNVIYRYTNNTFKTIKSFSDFGLDDKYLYFSTYDNKYTQSSPFLNGERFILNFSLSSSNSSGYTFKYNYNSRATRSYYFTLANSRDYTMFLSTNGGFYDIAESVTISSNLTYLYNTYYYNSIFTGTIYTSSTTSKTSSYYKSSTSTRTLQTTVTTTFTNTSSKITNNVNL